MKILLYGKNSEEIEELVKSLGFELVAANPGVVISYGGDGTLLSSERLYPGIPKLPIRDSRVCQKCSEHSDQVVLKALLNGQLKLEKHQKLHTMINGQDLLALNDFVIRNNEQIHAVRFNINNHFFIGDGIVAATPFGSTGYFKSITGQTLETGFGVAFNNTTQKIPPLILKQADSVNFQLIRGKAVLSFDNNPDIVNVDEGSEVVFRLSDKIAKIYEADSLRCPNCQIKH